MLASILTQYNLQIHVVPSILMQYKYEIPMASSILIHYEYLYFPLYQCITNTYGTSILTHHKSIGFYLKFFFLRCLYLRWFLFYVIWSWFKIVLCRSSNALQGSPFVTNLIPAVGIIIFTLWGLGPLMRMSRSIFLRVRQPFDFFLILPVQWFMYFLWLVQIALEIS